MKVKIAMNPTDSYNHLRTTEEILVEDQESDYDDDDRRELITQYANEKYLSKWELADEDEAEHEKDITLHVHVPRNDAKLDPPEKETDNSKTESVHLAHVATLDRDDLSLVSYNSIRDCCPSATPKTVPLSGPSHVGQLPQAISEGLKLWQGYGGNIYFDAVKCQSMRINSARSGQSRKQDISKRWKSKSFTVVKRRDEQQVHTACVPSAPENAPTASIHSVGSLRMRSCKEKKCRMASCRHKDTTRHLSGKICKGFSEKLITETFQKFHEERGKTLSKQPLAVSGGHVGDTGLDAIDKVQQFNSQLGFPAVLSDGSFSVSHHGQNKGIHVVSGDDYPYIKLPLLGKHEGKRKICKPEDRNSDDRGKLLNEPTPVFIIPFGAFDDPVDSEFDLKRKDRKEMKVSAGTSGDGMNSSLGSKKEIRSQSGGSESSSFTATENNDVGDTTCVDVNDNVVKQSVRVSSGALDQDKAVKQGIPDFHLKREISNLSLSNYLRAVPSRGTKEQNGLSTPQSALMPKMSYTKRSEALPTFYMVNNTLHHVPHTGFNQKASGSPMSGGYQPSTGKMEPKLFYAEISTNTEKNYLRSDGVTQNESRRSKNSGNMRTNSPRISKHVLLRASYVSRNSFTRQSVERSPRRIESVNTSGRNVLPVTGQQISRFSVQHR